MLIDTHCHLDAHEFSEDRDAVVQAALKAQVSKILIPSVTSSNFAMVRQCCSRYPSCLPAYGIHPLYVDQASEHELVNTREWLLSELSGAFPPVAVGEIGLDFFVPDIDPARQEHYFIEQLKIAREVELPVLLHIRRAIDQVLKCLRRIPVRGGIAHAFNGSRQQANEFIKLGFKLGFGGAMTYPRATRIRQLATTLPLESIVLETDAPDIPPIWLTGLPNPRNSPQQLLPIAQTLAELRSLNVAQIIETTGANAHAVIQGLDR